MNEQEGKEGLERSLELEVGPGFWLESQFLEVIGLQVLVVVRAVFESLRSMVKITNCLEDPREWSDGRDAAHKFCPSI